MESAPCKFTIRVYGIFINKNKEVLLSDEFYSNVAMTKFPGGGMEYGEGTLQTLQREIDEELGLEITNIRHFYTTDFFQKAIFRVQTQLLSIYYLADFVRGASENFGIQKMDYTHARHGQTQVRWLPIAQLTPNMLTFPIDQHVAKLIVEKYDQ